MTEMAGQETLGPEPQQSDGGKGDQTIAIDLDGVLHKYSKGWHTGDMYDEPMPGAVDAVRALQAAGYQLVVFTARRELDLVRAWLDEHFGEFHLEATNEKPIASLYVDDRGLRFNNWDRALVAIAVLFGRREPWACPFDTDGDGNCGKPACPYCLGSTAGELLGRFNRRATLR